MRYRSSRSIPGGKRPSSAEVEESAEWADDDGRLMDRGGLACGSTTVSVWELLATGVNNAAQFPQKRLVGEFSVAQLGQRTMGCSVSSVVASGQPRWFSPMVQHILAGARE